MPAALITDVGSATLAAAGSSALAFAAPNTNVVRNSALTSKTSLVGLWANGTVKSSVAVTSPNIVPVANGISADVPSGLSGSILPASPAQALTPQDTLNMNATVGAAGTVQAAIAAYYADLPSSGMALKNPGDITGQTEFVFGWPVAAKAGAAIGEQGNTVVTASMDSSIANRWYALLGYLVDTAVTAVGLSGTDTSLLFVGGPGDPASRRTRNYFQDLSLASGMPCIPLFNAANKGNTNVTVVDVAAATAVNVTMILAQMVETYQP